MNIIVIANNFLSETSNNGKTLKYLLSNYSEENIVWIYTTPLQSDFVCNVKKIRINFFGVWFWSGVQDFKQRKIKFNYFITIIKEYIKRITGQSGFIFDFLKIIRDLNVFIRNKRILTELSRSEFKADKVLFVAGDCLSLHYLARKITIAFDLPMDVFVTDDYVLKFSKNDEILRRPGVYNYLLKNAFEKTFSASVRNHFICNKMLRVYSDFFGVKGCLSFNSGAVNNSLGSVSDSYKYFILDQLSCSTHEVKFIPLLSNSDLLYYIKRFEIGLALE